MRRATSVLVLVLTGCVPQLPEGRLTCANNDDCPAEWHCRAERCYRGAGGDAGQTLDAGPSDAGVRDAGLLDADVLDADVRDAGVLDAGALDAGGDAGTTPPPLLRQVTVGFDHACVRTNDRTLYCWGNNGYGQLGDGTFAHRGRPAVVPGLSDLAFASAGARGTCARTTTGVLSCWGDGTNGGNGDGTTMNRPSPVEIALPEPATYIGRGWSTSCVATASALHCWGSHEYFGLQDATAPSLSPIPMTLPGPPQLFEVHGPTLVFIGGVLHAFGTNTNGELGDGTTITRTNPPAVVPGITLPAQIGSAAFGACALVAGEVRCWGHIDGAPVLTHTTVPLSRPALSLAVGYQHTCAILDDRTVECWGRNDFGEVGNGTTVVQPAPVPVTGLTDVQQIDAGQFTTCALVGALPTDQLYCWGRNTSGQLGDGTTTSSSVPVRVVF